MKLNAPEINGRNRVETLFLPDSSGGDGLPLPLIDVRVACRTRSCQNPACPPSVYCGPCRDRVFHIASQKAEPRICSVAGCLRFAAPDDKICPACSREIDSWEDRQRVLRLDAAAENESPAAERVRYIYGFPIPWGRPAWKRFLLRLAIIAILLLAVGFAAGLIDGR